MEILYTRTRYEREHDLEISWASEGECDELFELEPINVIEKLCKS